MRWEISKRRTRLSAAAALTAHASQVSDPHTAVAAFLALSCAASPQSAFKAPIALSYAIAPSSAE